MKQIIQIIYIVWAISACANDNSQGKRIPPLPTHATANDRVLEMLSNMIDAYPNNSEIYFKRAAVFLDKNKLNEALNDIDKAFFLRKEGKYLFLKAEILKELNQNKEALDIALQAEFYRIKTPEFYSLLAYLFQENKQFGKANNYANRAIAVSPNNGLPFYVKGLIATKTADTLSAIAFFQKSQQLKPTYLYNYLKLSEIYTALRDYETAMIWNRKGFLYYPASAELFLKQAVTYHKSWRIDSAVYCYKKAMVLKPTLYQASFSAGILYFKIRNYYAALAMFEHTLKQNAKLPLLNYYLGQCFEYIGRPEQALEFYTIAVQLNASDYKSMNGFWRVKRRLMGEYLPPILTDESGEISVPQKKVDTLRLPDLSSLTPKQHIKRDSILQRNMNIDPK